MVKIAVPDGVGVVVVDAPVVVTLVVGSAVAMVDSAAIVTHAHTQTIVFTTMYRQTALAEKTLSHGNSAQRSLLQRLCSQRLHSLTLSTQNVIVIS